MFSRRCATWEVAGIAQVTAGCETTNLRKYCAQFVQSNSAAQAGNGWPCTRPNSAPPSNAARTVCGVPIVAGETGAGGMATSVPAAMKQQGVCIVYGHGIFSAGVTDFQDAFLKMAEVENRCREEYFRLAEEKYG